LAIIYLCIFKIYGFIAKPKPKPKPKPISQLPKAKL
jgi:hypothetical protein